MSRESSSQVRCRDPLFTEIGGAEAFECEPDERFELGQSTLDIGSELTWGADEIEEARRVHLLRCEAGQRRELSGVALGACDDERKTMLRTIDRRVDDLLYEGADELRGRVVARHNVG